MIILTPCARLPTVTATTTARDRHLTAVCGNTNAARFTVRRLSLTEAAGFAVAAVVVSVVLEIYAYGRALSIAAVNAYGVCLL